MASVYRNFSGRSISVCKFVYHYGCSFILCSTGSCWISVIHNLNRSAMKITIVGRRYWQCPATLRIVYIFSSLSHGCSKK